MVRDQRLACIRGDKEEDEEVIQQKEPTKRRRPGLLSIPFPRTDQVVSDADGDMTLAGENFLIGSSPSYQASIYPIAGSPNCLFGKANDGEHMRIALRADEYSGALHKRTKQRSWLGH